MDRKFWALYFSQLFSVIGDGLFRILLIFIALDIGGASLLSLIFSAQAATIALTVLFSGVLNNYIKPKVIVIGSTLIRLIICIYIYILLINNIEYNFYFIIIGIIFGLSDSLYRPNYLSVLNFNTTKEKYDVQISILTSSRQLFNILTPIASGLLIDLFNNKVIIISIALIYMSSMMFSIMLKDRSVQKIKTNKNVIKDLFIEINEGINYLKNVHWLKVGMLVSIFVIPFQQALSSVLVPVFVKSIDPKAISYSYILTSYAIGAMLGSVLFSKVGSYINSIYKTFIIIFVAYFIYTFSGITNNLLVTIIVSFVIGMLIQIYNISWEKFTIRDVEEKYIGNISSISWFIFSSLSPIMISLVGFLLKYYSVRTLIIILPFLICLIITIIFIYGKKKGGKLYDTI